MQVWFIAPVCSEDSGWFAQLIYLFWNTLIKMDEFFHKGAKANHNKNPKFTQTSYSFLMASFTAC